MRYKGGYISYDQLINAKEKAEHTIGNIAIFKLKGDNDIDNDE